MKKWISLMLALTMALALCACGSTKDDSIATAETASAAEPAEDFVWTREGYFADEDDNMLMIFPSEDEEYPGWSVTCLLGEDIIGWFIQQEGETLHGNLASPYMEDEGEFIVTLSEEGADGVLLELEDGSAYHMTPYDVPTAAFAVMVNIDGFGQIAYAEGTETPEFDDEFPSQSAYIGLAEVETYTFAAKPDEGWKFMEWTYNGEDYSTEPQITLEINEDAELVAVFGIGGTNEEPVDLDSVTTLGELLGLPEYGMSCFENKYVYAFEQDGNIYRAVADMPDEVFDAYFALDWDDPDYDAKVSELISPLEIVSITNLSETEPTQEEMDALIGRTGEELFHDGWSSWGWNLEDMEFYFDHGAYSYIITFEGEIENPNDFDEEDIYPLVVASVRYDGIGDPAALDEPGE